MPPSHARFLHLRPMAPSQSPPRPTTGAPWGLRSRLLPRLSHAPLCCWRRLRSSKVRMLSPRPGSRERLGGWSGLPRLPDSEPLLCTPQQQQQRWGMSWQQLWPGALALLTNAHRPDTCCPSATLGPLPGLASRKCLKGTRVPLPCLKAHKPRLLPLPTGQKARCATGSRRHAATQNQAGTTRPHEGEREHASFT